jgi:hypothetical protein
MTSKLQGNPPALKREHPKLQNMKFLQFFSFFVGHFSPVVRDQDPDDQNQCGSGFEADGEPG